jgi:Fe-S-cluster containining protein
MTDIVLRRHRLTHLPELRVEPSMLTARFAADCSMSRCTGRCCAHGVYVELAERQAILDNAAAIQAQMDASQARNPAVWFDPEPIEDADFVSGRAVGTAEVNGGCVFLNEAGRCVLQKASTIQTGNLKPFFCVAFPVTIDKGALCLDDPRAVDCCTPDPGGQRTVFDLCARELDHVLGADGVGELRRLFSRDPE